MNFKHYAYLYILSLLSIISACNKKKEITIQEEKKEVTTPTKEKTEIQKETEAAQQTYIVIARSGLFVRAQPSSTGTKLSKIPYGAKVTLLENTDQELVVNENGYKIHGNWVLIEENKSSKKGYVFNGYLKTTEELNEYITRYNLHEQKKPSYTIYPIHTLSKNIHGILIEVKNDDFNYVDYMSDYDEIKNYEYYNNTILPVYKDERVTKKFNHFREQEFYIIGKEGEMKTKPSDVLFMYNGMGCHPNFIFLPIPDFNTKKYGIPYFATSKPLTLHRGPFLKEASHHNHIINIQNLLIDCVFENDTRRITFFAQDPEGMTLGYRDVQTLQKDMQSIDPYRNIVYFHDTIFSYYMYGSLDLYGCGCL